jgi:hypothetical protein
MPHRPLSSASSGPAAANGSRRLDRWSAISTATFWSIVAISTPQPEGRQ